MYFTTLWAQQSLWFLVKNSLHGEWLSVTGITRGEHAHESVEGNEEKQARINVSRVDKEQISQDEDEIMGNLSRLFPSQQYRLFSLGADPSGEVLSVRITFSEQERRIRTGGLGGTLRVKKSEIDERLKR